MNKYKDSDKNKLITVGPKNNGVFLKVGDLNNYVDNTLYSAYDLWFNWRLFGLPSSGGWGDHPKRIIDAITIIDKEYKSFSGGN